MKDEACRNELSSASNIISELNMEEYLAKAALCRHCEIGRKSRYKADGVEEQIGSIL